jgi:hypothetical protein
VKAFENIGADTVIVTRDEWPEVESIARERARQLAEQDARYAPKTNQTKQTALPFL